MHDSGCKPPADSQAHNLEEIGSIPIPATKNSKPRPVRAARGFSFGVAMALASHAYRDPMEILSAKQEREARQPKRERTANCPLPEYPRRWIEPQTRSKSFTEFLAEESTPKSWSPVRKALEDLFA